jgi:hypothetical protein
MNLRSLIVCSCIALVFAGDGFTEVKRWRVGDRDHPWNLVPVTGRLTWGRGWTSEILVDGAGDGLIDEDPVELVDNDGDGLVNEDPSSPQVDNDQDDALNEDPVDNLDNDGDGLIDEDPVEAFDEDRDGLIDEDGLDQQIDNDGDGLLNEDGLWTDGADDFDTLWNEDPVNGVDDDGDGLTDEDGPQLAGDPDNNITTWLRPIRLDSGRNLATMLNQRYLLGEFGGIVEGKPPSNPFMEIPGEGVFRTEKADPISADYFQVGSGGNIGRSAFVHMVDGDVFTAYGSADPLYGTYIGNRVSHGGGPAFNLMGFFRIKRIFFRPRPTVPEATIASYAVIFGDPTTVNTRRQVVDPNKFLIREVLNDFRPVKDIQLDQSVLMGRIDIVSLDALGALVETAEAGLFGDGYPTDAIYISEIIDVGTPVPRLRRYSRQTELFSASERDIVEAEFPDLPGGRVNWGRVRWRGRRDGDLGTSASSSAPGRRLIPTSTRAIQGPPKWIRAMRRVSRWISSVG